MSYVGLEHVGEETDPNSCIFTPLDQSQVALMMPNEDRPIGSSGNDIQPHVESSVEYCISRKVFVNF